MATYAGAVGDITYERCAQHCDDEAGDNRVSSATKSERHTTDDVLELQEIEPLVSARRLDERGSQHGETSSAAKTSKPDGVPDRPGTNTYISARGLSLEERRRVFRNGRKHTPLYSSVDSQDSGVRSGPTSGSTCTTGSANTTPPRGASTDSRTHAPPDRQTSVPGLGPAYFDQLFESGGQVRFPCPGYTGQDSVQVESIDESVGCSFEKECTKRPDVQAVESAPPVVARSDSVMELSFMELLVRNWQNCRGICSFRRRLANDVNHKYCSYCRVDDIIFLFLHVAYGMLSITAGWLGYVNCGDACVSYYLVLEGFLSVFIFPVSIMEWSKRVGGCVNDDQKVGTGVWFGLIFLLRLVTVIAGTVLLVFASEEPSSDNLMCSTVFTIFTMGVILDWAVLVLVLLLPLCLFGTLYCIVGVVL